MKKYPKGEITALFPTVARINKIIKEAKKRFPEEPFISESIEINEKFLSYREQIKKSGNNTIPDELNESLVEEMSFKLRLALISITKREDETRILKDIFLESDVEAYNKLTSN